MVTKEAWKIILETKEDCQKVLDAMREIIEGFSAVTVFDLFELVGLTSRFKFAGLGWSKLDDVEIKAAEGKGWFIDFPEPEVFP